MIAILFISDDIRTAELIARLQPHFRGRLRLAADFDQGLKEVFDNRPAAVFIQSEISGISGETVARHVKTLLRVDAPRIILTHSGPLRLQGGKKWFDDTIDLSLAESELLEQFRQRLAEIAPGQWLEPSPPAEPPAEPPAAGLEASGAAAPQEFEFFDWESPEPVPLHPPPETGVVVPPPAEAVVTAPFEPVSAVEPLSSSEGAPAPTFAEPVKPQQPQQAAPSTPKTSAPVPGRSAPAPSASSSVSPFPAPPVATAAGSAPAAPKAPSVDDFDTGFFDELPPESLSVPPDATAPIGGAKRGRLLIWSATGGLLLAAAVGGHLFFKGGAPSVPSAVKQTPAAPVAVAQGARDSGLGTRKAKAIPDIKPQPSFIPKGGRDTAFARANPGWERYRANGREFRLYREKGRLRAVQVIASGNKGIPDAFVAAALGEVAGSEERKAVSRTQKGVYLVESGRIAGDGEIVVYRKKDGSIRGVVISLP